MRKIEINDLAHSGINSNIKKVADIPDDYDDHMKPFEWVLCGVGAILLIVFILGLLL